MSTDLSIYYNAQMGSFASTVEVLLQHPLITHKNSIQSNYKISSLRHIYKGVGINVITMAPLTSVQFAGFGYFNNITKNIFKQKHHRSIISSTVAGGLSGLIAGPAELFIVQQQKYNNKFLESYRNVRNKYGISRCFRGTLPCIFREAIYTCGYCSLTPLIEKKLITYSPNHFKQKSIKTSITASIAAGLVAGSVSHPFDTIKTYTQSHVNKKPIPLIKNAIKKEGISFLFKGIIPRSIRIVGTFFIFNECSKFYINSIYPLIKN